MRTEHHIERGVHNLLDNCVELKAGESLLIICEDPKLGWYDASAPQAVAAGALKRGDADLIVGW